MIKEKMLFTRITNIDNTADVLKEIGVAIKDSFGNLRDVDDILTDLWKSWKSLSREQQKYLKKHLH